MIDRSEGLNLNLIVFKYLIPIKIRAPLKGASLRSKNARKLKGEGKTAQMNKKPANLQ